MRQLVEQLGPLLVSRLAELQKSCNEVIHGLVLSSIFRLDDSWAKAEIISKTMFLRTP
jgi:hypothetical protein